MQYIIGGDEHGIVVPGGDLKVIQEVFHLFPNAGILILFKI